MKAVWGYDSVKKSYWYYIEIMNVEVHSEKGLNRKELEKAKEKNSMYQWYKDTDFAY